MAVAAALVHLVLRGRDIGLPRSTLPVRYSFPLLLCIIHGYPAYVRVHLPSPPRTFSSFFQPRRSCADSPPSTLFRSYLALLYPSSRSGFLFIYIYKSNIRTSSSIHLFLLFLYICPSSPSKRWKKSTRKPLRHRAYSFIAAAFPSSEKGEKEREREYSSRIIIN